MVNLGGRLTIALLTWQPPNGLPNYHFGIYPMFGKTSAEGTVKESSENKRSDVRREQDSSRQFSLQHVGLTSKCIQICLRVWGVVWAKSLGPMDQKLLFCWVLDFALASSKNV